MSVISKGRQNRLVAIAAMIAVVAGAIVFSDDAPASAAVQSGPGCTVSSGYETNPSPNKIIGYYYITCEDRTTGGFINILKLVNGTWTTVAFGNGLATYTCNGNAENEYEVITSKTQTFDDSCG